VKAHVHLDRLPVGPWLPRSLAPIPLLASGEARLGYRRGRPVTGTAELELEGPGGLRLLLTGASRGREVSGHVSGDVDLASWSWLLRHTFTGLAGTLHVDATVVPAAGMPRLSGTVEVSRAVRLGLPGWRVPLTIAPGGKLEVDGDSVSTRGLALSSSGIDAVVAGSVDVDRRASGHSQVSLALSAALDVEQLPFTIPGTSAARGHVLVEGTVVGDLGQAPRLDGVVRLDRLSLRFPSSALPRVRATGELHATGNAITVSDLAVELARIGSVRIGSANDVARTEVRSLVPFRLGDFDVPLAGEHLVFGGSTAALRVEDLNARLRVAGDAGGQVRVAGTLEVEKASYDGKRGGPSHGPSKPWFRQLPPWLTLDLDLRGPDRAFSFALPVLPDLGFDFHCHLLASRDGVSASGRIVGDTLYARAALRLYGWLSPTHLDRCQLPTH
jgi:hypothetical protein